MTEFYRFPSTPHLAWLGEGLPRSDKVLSGEEVTELLAGEVVVEEKIDGANLGLSLAPGHRIRAQNRGNYLLGPYTGQFSRLTSWIDTHQEELVAGLDEALILFGEWCTAKHSLLYDALPDWFLLFDVYDRGSSRYWNTKRRNEFAKALKLHTVPQLLRGHATLHTLEELLASSVSRFAQGPMEGLVVRHESAEWCDSRAKLVQAKFHRIEEHWRSRRLEWNRVRETSDG